MSSSRIPLVFAFLCAMAPSLAWADVNMGMLANRGELKAREEYGELAVALGKATGQNVTLVPLPMEKIESSFANKEVDIILVNPVLAAQLVHLQKAEPLVTVHAKDGYEFGGVILANKASGVTKSEDLKGKKVMSYSSDSAGAYVFQTYHLKTKGIDVHKDLAAFTAAKKQDDIPMAVKAGLFDAGFVRTGLLESMEKKGTLKVDDFVIVDKVASAGEVRTTDLYPEWMVLSQSGADKEGTDKLRTALLSFKPTDAAVQKANIKGFVEARDLAGLLEVMKTLKMPPFDK